jgi:hypothetical protein
MTRSFREVVLHYRRGGRLTNDEWREPIASSRHLIDSGLVERPEICYHSGRLPFYP